MLERTGAFVSCALGVVFLAAGLAFPAGEARAANECGTWSTSATSHTCSDGAQASGIEYSNVAGAITVTVTGGAATTIDAVSGRGWNSVGAVVVTALDQGAEAAASSRAIALTVGSDSNAVVIAEHGTASNSGVLVHQYGRQSTDETTVTLGSGVRIGTSSAPMRKFGVWLLSTADDNTATQTVTSAATIHSMEYGIVVDNRGAGDSVVTNSGAITTSETGGNANDKAGIRILDWSASLGADRTADTTTTVTNSGSITTSAARGHGIQVEADGLGLYKVVHSGTISTAGEHGSGIWVDADDHKGAAGTTAVEIESSGAITTSGAGAHGINVFEWKDDDASSARSGNVRVTTTGGTITTSGANAHGIILQTKRGHATDPAMASGDATITNAATVRASGRSGADGLHLDNQVRVTVADGTTTTHTRSGNATITNTGAVTATSHGILLGQSGTGNAEVTNRGAVTATGQEFSPRYGIRVVQGGTGNARVTNHGAITAIGTIGYGIHVGSSSDGDITVTNTAAIEVSSIGSSYKRTADGIHVGKNPPSSGDITITNSGDIEAERHGIVVWYGGEGDVRIDNRGAITPAPDTDTLIGIQADFAGAGDVVIENAAAVTAVQHGIFARNTEGGGGAVTVTHRAGEVRSMNNAGITALMGHWRNEDAADSDDPNSTATVRVEVTGGTVKASETYGRPAIDMANNEGGSAEVSISQGAALTARHNVGIFAYLSDRQNTGGRIDVDQGGAITARGGVYALVTRASAAGETRAANERLIDVEWSGTFTQVEADPDPDPDRLGSWNNVAHAVEGAQEAQAGEVIRGASTSAGIDAEVLSWRVLNRIATRGDDPGTVTLEKQNNLLSEGHPDSRMEYILNRFRTVLTVGTVAIPGADDIDANDDGEYSNDELRDYLRTDRTDRRNLVRDILARDLSGAEAAVLEAVATGASAAEVDAALDGVTGASDDWKQEVRDLLGRYNVGDVRVAMTGGSIASGGDGIRAWYARQHDRNGRIDVSVAAGATVSGGVAGVYVSGAGTGLRVAKKYTSPAVQAENENLGPDELVTFPDYLAQVVRVDGTVTGGTDAAVHLAGGGALIVSRTGKLVAGSSGQAILVNDPGPAVIFIDGEVTGGAGPEDMPSPAAVYLTGGGSVTLGVNGRVRPNGAAAGFRGDETTPVVLLTERTVGDLTQGSARKVLERAGGEEGFAGDGITQVTIAELRDNGTTGHETPPLPVRDGKVVLDGLPPDPVPPTPPVGPIDPPFYCDKAEDGRCRLYEALPSMLLSMNGLPSYAERMSAARDAIGGWARVESARGKWQAKKADSSGDLAYDHRRTVGRAGFDVIVGEDVSVGGSLHVLRGKAEMSGAGEAREARLDGAGVALSATWLPKLSAMWLPSPGPGEPYVDAQAGVTRYDVELDSARHGKLVKDADATGYALGVEAGHRMAFGEDLTVTPRAGLAWSKVDLKGFTDRVGSGAAVAMKDARSTKGRLGVLVETEVGSGSSPGRVFGSLDVEREFSDDTEVVVSGERLSTKVRPTALRVGLGGVFNLAEDFSLRASASYTTSGGGTNEYGGAVELNYRF